MKKAIYLFAAAAFMASCNQEVLIDETTNAQPEVNRRIGFDTFVDKATRAQGTNSTALNDFYTSFNVYGWKTVGGTTTDVFSNIPVEYFAEDKQGKVAYVNTGQKPSDEWTFTANNWYYENIRYWDKLASAYLFSAYAPATASESVVCLEDGTITIGNETTPVTVDSKNLMATPATALAYTGFDWDYMTAQTKYEKPALTAGNYINSAVSLNFSHLQAKLNIRIKLAESITTAQDVSIKKIEFHNLGDKGYYTNEDGIGVSGWTLYKEEENTPATTDETPAAEYIPTVTGPYSLNDATTNYDDYYVLEQLIIPQTIAKYVVESTPESNAPAKRANGEDGATNGEGSDVNNGNADGSTEQEPEEQPTTPVVTIPVSLDEYTEACVYVEYTIGDELFKSYSPLANMFTTAATYDLKGGYQYTLNIIVGPKPIYFTTEVTPWTEEQGGDLPMN